MFKPTWDKLVYFVLGVIATGGVLAVGDHKNDQRMFEAMATAIEDGDFCPASPEEAELLKSQVEEIYFVGCGGFF